MVKMKNIVVFTEFPDPGGITANPSPIFHNGLRGGIGKMRGFHNPVQSTE
jgi:hypothetical protein